jgi:hypothetical protein
MMRCFHFNHTRAPHHNNHRNHLHLRHRAKVVSLESRSSGNARWHSCDASNVSRSRRRASRRRQARSMVDQAMQMYLIDVKWRMPIVSATARGVTAAGRTTAGTDIADGIEFLVGVKSFLGVVLLSFGCMLIILHIESRGHLTLGLRRFPLSALMGCMWLFSDIQR